MAEFKVNRFGNRCHLLGKKQKHMGKRVVICGVRMRPMIGTARPNPGAWGLGGRMGRASFRSLTLPLRLDRGKG